MAGKYGDSRELRLIDRIEAVAWREAMEDGASFINRNWIAKKLNRSVRSVTDNWKKNDTELLENLLLSCTDRLKAVIDNNGGHTDY